MAGIASGNLAGAGSGANTAKNEVENNSLCDIIDNKVSGVSQEDKYQNVQKQLVAVVEEFKAQLPVQIWNMPGRSMVVNGELINHILLSPKMN